MLTMLNPYLKFDRTCAEAMRFYQSVLGGELFMLPVSQSPMAADCAPADKDLIMHASLLIGPLMLMASDAMDPQAGNVPKGFAVTLTYDTAEEARGIYAKLAAGGQTPMPIEPSFWAEAFGCAIDRFGTTWLINGGMKPMQAQS